MISWGVAQWMLAGWLTATAVAQTPATDGIDAMFKPLVEASPKDRITLLKDALADLPVAPDAKDRLTTMLKATRMLQAGGEPYEVWLPHLMSTSATERKAALDAIVVGKSHAAFMAEAEPEPEPVVVEVTDPATETTMAAVDVPHQAWSPDALPAELASPWRPAVPAPLPSDALGPMSFAGLVIVADDGDVSGLSDARLKQHVVQHLRDRGFEAVGGLKQLFDEASDAEARFALGGTLSDSDLSSTRGIHGLLLTIDWQLYDRAEGEVAYEVTTHGFVPWVDLLFDPEIDSEVAFDHALDRVLARPGFRAVLLGTGGPTTTDDGAPQRVPVQPCDVGPAALPKGLPALLAGTVTVKAGSRTGSGFLISPDGAILTAAHVVGGGDSVQVTLAQGLTLPASVVAFDRASDVALVDLVGGGHVCLPLETTAPQPGAALFVAGTPTGQLSSSVSRGIVSSVRDEDGRTLLQTDASISPGHSGGPAADDRGRVVGLVQKKVVGTGVEGIGFALGVTDALDAAGVHWTPDAPVDRAAAARASLLPQRLDDLDDPADFTPSRVRVCTKHSLGPKPGRLTVDGQDLGTPKPTEVHCWTMLPGTHAIGLGPQTTTFTGVPGTEPRLLLSATGATEVDADRFARAAGDAPVVEHGEVSKRRR